MKFLLPAFILAVFSISWLHHNTHWKIQKKPDTARVQITVPVGGNTFSSSNTNGARNIGKEGITKWTDEKMNFTTYVRINQPGTLKLSLNLKVPDGKSRLKISVQGISKEINVEGNSRADYYVGEWTLKDTGYIACNITGINRSGSVFADVNSIIMDGSSINERTAYVKDNEGNFFYWGRRGPSVHLGYTLPTDIQAEWFYNEVTVPLRQDVIGSYFMADGFAEGYFGFQVNSSSERRILFSVWSPFKTDNPQQIPKEQKIQLLKKGEDVHAGEFGNEGSGGQSYLRYVWKARTTYRFLLHGKPEDSTHTVFTAYFYAPEANKWLLIASFKRPKTNTYLKRLHSFLENFSPEQGNIERSVLFNNQWVRDSKGQWMELNKARFTGDNTAVKGYRMDYGGGINNNAFYLRNCGFFKDYTPLNSSYERQLSGEQPMINLESLEKSEVRVLAK
ncbi:MAG: DUF3472 domain-containing protein [Chitinophagaceae bacterium]